MEHRPTIVIGILLVVLWVTNFPHPAAAIDEKWKAEMIADALRAAPPSVTHNATIFAWNAEGELILVRHGAGPYTCFASGLASLRLGKPPLPYPDPLCMDQNAWAYFQARWSKQDPLPTAPGLIWMLAGMNIKKQTVLATEREESVVKATKGQAGEEMSQMTPHIMIMPLPFDKKIAKLPTRYDPQHPLQAWIMAAGKPVEHLMIHFSNDDVKGMMEAQ